MMSEKVGSRERVESGKHHPRHEWGHCEFQDEETLWNGIVLKHSIA